MIVAAPKKLAQGLLWTEEVGTDRIEVHVIANCAQITIAAAIDDQGLVVSAKEVAE